MPLTRLAADAFGVVTICLVSLLVLLGLLCVFYSVYFQSRIRKRDYAQLGYFNGPSIIRIVLVLIAIWWGLGEIVRLSLLRGRGRILHSLSSKWQENVCKFYILSNLGFAEPSLFLTLVFLLQASLQRRELGTLSWQWNRKMIGHIILFCFPIFMLQLGLVLIGPKLGNKHVYFKKLPHFTRTSISSSNVVDCTYPLLSTIAFGLFSSLLIAYFVYLGARVLSLVINKGLRRRVYLLIISVISFLPLRILFIGFSALSHPGQLAFESLIFLAFLVLFACAVVGICVLVYYPIADSLAVSSYQHVEMGEEPFDANDSLSPIANQSLLQVASPVSAGRNSDASMKGGSISFRMMIRDDSTLSEGVEEVNLLSSGAHNFQSSPDSPVLPRRPMIPLGDVSKF